MRYVHGTSLTWQGVLGTRAVLIGVAMVIVAQFAFTYLPPLQAIFDSRPVALSEGLVIVGVGVVLLVLSEAEKRLAALWQSPPDRGAAPGPGRAAGPAGGI